MIPSLDPEDPRDAIGMYVDVYWRRPGAAGLEAANRYIVFDRVSDEDIDQETLGIKTDVWNILTPDECTTFWWHYDDQEIMHLSVREGWFMDMTTVRLVHVA